MNRLDEKAACYCSCSRATPRSHEAYALTDLLCKVLRFRKYPTLRTLSGPSGTTQQPVARCAAIAGMMLTPKPQATKGKIPGMKRVLSIGRYGRGLAGFGFVVSLWPNSRSQNVGCGWGRTGGRGLYPCRPRALGRSGAGVKAACGLSCFARTAAGDPCSRSLPPSGWLVAGAGSTVARGVASVPPSGTGVASTGVSAGEAPGLAAADDKVKSRVSTSAATHSASPGEGVGCGSPLAIGGTVPHAGVAAPATAGAGEAGELGPGVTVHRAGAPVAGRRGWWFARCQA